MKRPRTKRKCKHCQTFFDPDPRSAKRQRHCSKPACRQASKAASQHRWLQKPGNRDYFTGPTHVERVRQWRQTHPGYWRRQGAPAPHALQEDFTLQEPQKQSLDEGLTPPALQDVFFMQPTVVVGLIAHLTGLALQEDIAATARRLQQLGRDILSGATSHQEASRMDKRPISLAKLRTVPSQFSWVDQRLVRERYIDQLSHEACALSLFLVIVADAQGLSYYAEPSLCQRLSLTGPELHQARQALITQGLVAYQRPLYQVLALDAVRPEATTRPSTVGADDEPVDIKAVFARIWEVLS